MQTYWTLTRRELAGYFVSLTGYVVIAAATFLLSGSFVVLLKQLQGTSMPVPITEVFFTTWIYVVFTILVVMTPVITMRLFALEKYAGTFETLMTTSVSDLQVVLAKFTAGLAFYVVMWLPLASCLLVVQHYANDASFLDGGCVASTFLGILLLGSVFVSLGCCASALTRSQVIAAIITLFVGGIFVLLGYLWLFWVTWCDLRVVTRLAYRDPEIGSVAGGVRVVFLLYGFFSIFADLWLNPITYAMLGLIIVMRRYVESLPEPAAATALPHAPLGRAVAAA
jgi:ABC-2 type transport system permease protein